MILGHSELKKLIEKCNLVTNLSEREMKDPEGCVFDLRLEKVFSLKGKAFLGIDERETPDLIEEASYNPKKRISFIINVFNFNFNFYYFLILKTNIWIIKMIFK